MRSKTIFLWLGMFGGAFAIGFQWVIPLFQRYILKKQNILIPDFGVHQALLFLILIPWLIVLLLMVAAGHAVARKIEKQGRRSERNKKGPANFVPFTELNVQEEVARLRTAFDAGITKNIAWRKKQLMSLVDLLDEHNQEIDQAIWQDLHKNKTEIEITETIFTRNEIIWLAENLDKLASPKRVKSSIAVFPSKSYIRSDPLGVVFIIGTWNLPFGLSILPLAGAIAGGNCAILKFAPLSEHFGPLMLSLLPKYLDMRCFTIEHSGGPSLVQSVLSQQLDLVFFTGSERVGRIINTCCAQRMIPCVLELGGKNPCIIDASANMRLSGKTISWGKFGNCGQTCISPDYVICIAGNGGNVAGRLIEELKKSIKSSFGENPEEQKRSESFGRLINVSAAERLEQFIEENRSHVVFGGVTDIQQKFVSPTIILDPPIDCTMMREEIFGPVLPIMNVGTLDEAIRLANSHGQPLALYVHSADKHVQERVLKETRSGAAVVNDCTLHYGNSYLPFGGIGSSGIGCYHGKYTFKTFVHERGVVYNSWMSEFINFSRYPPFTPFKDYLIKIIMPFN